MLTYFEIEQYIIKIINNIDGYINKIHCAGYEFDYSNSDIMAGEYQGFLSFYPKKIKETLDSYYNISQAYTQLLIITTHELSHINQNIDYGKYSANANYRYNIERQNETATFYWLVNNMDAIMAKFAEIDKNMILYASKQFDLDAFRNAINVDNRLRFIIKKFIRYPYDNDINKYPNIILDIKNVSYNIIKQDGVFINQDNILQTLCILQSYSNYYVANMVDKNNTMFIIVTLFDKDLTPYEIAYKH